MRLATFIGSILLLTAFCTAQSGDDLYGPPPPPPKPLHPEIHLLETHYEWPQPVLSGEDVTHTFAIHNRGAAVLNITNVTTSCGCQTVRYDKAIPPGGSGELVMTIRTTGLRRPTKKSATIESNDPNHPKVVVTSGGDIKAVLVTEPAYPIFEGLRGDVLTQTVKIKREAPGKLAILGVKASGTTEVEHEIVETKPGEEFDLHLRLKTAGSKGLYEGASLRFNIATKLGEKEVEVPLNARLKLVETINPSTKYVMFQYQEVQKFYKEGGPPPVKKVSVKGWEGKPFKVTKHEVKPIAYYKPAQDNPGVSPFKVVVEQGKDPSEWVVSVELLQIPEADRRSTSSEIVLSTDDPVTQQVTIRASVYFPPSTSVAKVPPSLSTAPSASPRLPTEPPLPRSGVIRPKQVNAERPPPGPETKALPQAPAKSPAPGA